MKSQRVGSFITAVVVVFGFALGSCGGVSGSCVGTGGIVDECKQDWTKDECSDWDDQGVNSANWDWSLKSCEDRGFDIQCSDGSYVQSSGDC